MGEGEFYGADKVWNISRDYVGHKVLKPLVEIQTYEKIARFGRESMEDIFPPEVLNDRRRDALERFYSTLIQIMSDITFSIKKQDREAFKQLSEDLELVNVCLSLIGEPAEHPVTHKKYFEINEVMFQKVFNFLQRIKTQLVALLNNANLIFGSTDELDLDDIQKMIEESG
jgi:hypothetical protein